MATSQPTEMQAEGKIDVDEAVKEILAGDGSGGTGPP